MAGAPEIFLILTMIMPREGPDKSYRIHMDSIEECMGDALAYVQNGVTEPMAKDGVIAVMGACLTTKKKEEADL